MRIVIDLLINLKKISNSTEIYNKIEQLANINSAININTIYETEGKNHFIEKNNMIIEVIFENKNNLYKFIKNINNHRLAKIDAIYYEDNFIKFIYKSKDYNNNQLSSQFDSINKVLNYLCEFS